MHQREILTPEVADDVDELVLRLSRSQLVVGAQLLAHLLTDFFRHFRVRADLFKESGRFLSAHDERVLGNPAPGRIRRGRVKVVDEGEDGCIVVRIDRDHHEA